jgi:hypothetical protein
MATSRLFALMPYALARDLGQRPFGVPAASGMIHLVGRVLRELHYAAQPERVLIWCALIGLFRPRVALQAEILVLRHQLNVLQRKSSKRVALSGIDRLSSFLACGACRVWNRSIISITLPLIEFLS